MQSKTADKKIHTAVESRIIECINYLVYSSKKSVLPIKEKDILKKANYLQSSFSAFKEKKRNMPMEVQQTFIQLLTNHYGVNIQFLQNGKGDILKYNFLKEPNPVYNSEKEDTLLNLEIKIKHLQETLADKIKIIEAQDSVIKNLQMMVEMLKPTSN